MKSREEIIHSLRDARARATTGRGREGLSRWIEVCERGTVCANGSIAIRGRVGLLRMLAALAGREELKGV